MIQSREDVTVGTQPLSTPLAGCWSEQAEQYKEAFSSSTEGIFCAAIQPGVL